MTRVGIITTDRLGKVLAGPAMRATSLAEACDKAGHVARLLSTSNGERAIAALVAQVDCLIVSGAALVESASLWTFEGPILYDAYCPFHLEQIEQNRAIDDLTREAWISRSQEVYSMSLQRADAIMCASDRQRDLIVGQLIGAQRLTPTLNDVDPGLRSTVFVVPFGVESGEPSGSAFPYASAFPTIAEGDPIVLWAGGIYDWLDASTPIKSVARLATTIPNIRLVFMSAQSVDGEMLPGAKAAIKLAKDLDLLDQNVFFNREWLEPDKRASYLTNATVGVCAAPATLESDYAFRTRYLDHFWAGLPTVCTTGDVLAAQIESQMLGSVVGYGDEAAMADAIAAIVNDATLRATIIANIDPVREHYRWANVTKPLVAWVDAPVRAPDCATRSPRLEERRNQLHRSRGFKVEMRAISRTYHEGGFSAVWEKFRERKSK
jgi:hypothetical protein